MYNIRNEYHSYELGHLIPIDYLQISVTIKIDLRRKNKYIACQNLVFIIHGKILKNPIRIINNKIL